MPQAKLDAAVALIRQHNDKATLITTDWAQLTGEQLIEAMEGNATLAADLAELEHEHHHHHHHHDHDEECCCGHDHDHEHHHHDHDENCTCGCHDHDHHHHHADEVFTSWGVETTGKFTLERVREILEELDSGEYGIVLRAKGIVAGQDGQWIHFDHVPGEADVRTGCAGLIGRLCVIGSKLNEKAIAGLFGV